jgi:hypothetical protein
VLPPSDAGAAGVVWTVVLPAPPIAGPDAVEDELDAAVELSVALVVRGDGYVGAGASVGSAVLACLPPQATVIAPIDTSTPAPATAATTLSLRCCDFTSDLTLSVGPDVDER